MTIKTRLNRKLIIIIVSFILIWPVIHTGLSLATGLNSWKLGGWGMYARAHVAEIGVNVFLIEEERRPLTEMKIGSVVKQKRVALFANGEMSDLDETAFGGVNPLDKSQIRYIQVFRRVGDIQNLVEQVKKLWVNPAKIAYSLVFITEPRLDMFNQYTYTDTAVYLVRNSCAQKLGVYSTDQHTVQEILSSIDAQVNATALCRH